MQPPPTDLLLIWLSPGFPVGAFAFSQGLEKAVEDGLVAAREGLAGWLGDLARHGSLRNDLILLAAAWRAATAHDAPAFAEAAELALALQPSAERHLETVTQGNAFLLAVRAAWPAPLLMRWPDATEPDPLATDTAYPVAVALATAAHAVPLAETLHAYAIAVAGNLVSAAIRLSVLGQTDGQRVMADLLPGLRAAATTAETTTLADVGGATFAADLASLAHETQYTRLFRS